MAVGAKGDVLPPQRSGRDLPLTEGGGEGEGGTEHRDHDATEIHRGKIAKKTNFKYKKTKE